MPAKWQASVKTILDYHETLGTHDFVPKFSFLKTKLWPISI